MVFTARRYAASVDFISIRPGLTRTRCSNIKDMPSPHSMRSTLSERSGKSVHLLMITRWLVVYRSLGAVYDAHNLSTQSLYVPL